MHDTPILLGGMTKRLFAPLDHAPHVADAFCATWSCMAMAKDLGRPPGAHLDGRTRVAFPDAVTVADVHQPLLVKMELCTAKLTRLQLIRINTI
jgi:hypothetical protein